MQYFIVSISVMEVQGLEISRPTDKTESIFLWNPNKFYLYIRLMMSAKKGLKTQKKINIHTVDKDYESRGNLVGHSIP